MHRIRSSGKQKFHPLFIAGLIFLSYPVLSQNFIADYTVATEEVLRSIPVEYINKARKEMVVAFQHTSHGTHVSRGLFGLPDYKDGDKQLFGVSKSPQSDKLELRDKDMADFAPVGVDAADLSRDETAFLQTTRNYLDAPENASVNVVMWAWCNIRDHDISGTYLPGMAALISEYSQGGSKIGSGSGKREVPVTFIFMTGHPIKNDNKGPGKPREQAALINEYCKEHGYFCLDYYSIDTHAMDGTYYEDAGDNADSDSYGGNFNEDWQKSHTLGVDYFESRFSPGSKGVPGSHNTQYITANRKAYAMWWILARIAGWDGKP